MEIKQKLAILADASKFDSCASTSSKRKVVSNDRIGSVASAGLCQSVTSDGRVIPLFKTLMTNACSYDCKYCQNSAGCRKSTVTFEPEELARLFMKLYIRNYAEGIFLSSGVYKSADYTTELMLKTIRILRNQFKFQGYVHFKVLPGTNYELVKQASEISDRLSVNLEAPSKSRLLEVSSVKDYKSDLLKRQAWIKKMNVPGGQTTQFVVGGCDESDLELMKMVDWEYKNMELKRAYFSAFQPVAETPLEFKNRTPLEREHRLYQVDFMLRKYNFKLDDFRQILDDGMLPRGDPKVFLARSTLEKPLEVNEASYDELLRVPGIGPVTASRIIRIRKVRKLENNKDLHELGVVLKRARPFIKINGSFQKKIGDYCG